MNFNYKVIDPAGKEVSGQIDATNSDLAVSSLQRRGFIVVSVLPDNQKKSSPKKLFFFRQGSDEGCGDYVATAVRAF